MTDIAVTWLSAGIGDVAQDEAWLDDELARRLATMRYAKRYSEARLGRWTAKLAIARTLGLALDLSTLRAVVVRNAPDGAPEAYVNGSHLDGVIAMTDRADWAVCARSSEAGCAWDAIWNWWKRAALRLWPTT